MSIVEWFIDNVLKLKGADGTKIKRIKRGAK